MQGNAYDNRRHSGRNLRVAGIGNMLLAIHHVFMDFGMKCIAHLAGRARYVDRHPILENRVHLKSM